MINKSFCAAAFLLFFSCISFSEATLFVSDVDETKAEQEIQEFLDYGCEVLVAIKNNAQETVRLRCSSESATLKSVRLPAGSSHIFSFKPLSNGSSVYYCTLAYRQYWVRFDVYSEIGNPYICPGKKVYRYSVQTDGVYANVTETHSEKIRALENGQNKFTLWENFDEKSNVADGLLMTGFVDGGMCGDLPYPFNDKASAITLCDHQCLYAYQTYSCHGARQKLQAGDGCKEFKISDYLAGRISSVKGC